jgi:hypothetical protein
MFRLIGNLIKLVTMVSTLMVAVDQIRNLLRKKEAEKNADFTETKRAA